ncbi:MAG: polysaccharide deacetylase family protein [Campylobacterales bacterium]|nr:polysaccharide deacetylase family protein [Campylobacterales bacterium]
MKDVNFLTFDIEEWFHANYKGIEGLQFCAKDTNLERNVDILIGMCARYNTQATCFILGDVAEQKPQIVKKLHSAGHEVASHGSSHKIISTMSSKEFEEDLYKSVDTLEQITGEKVLGFRAPSWSVNATSLEWFYGVLSKQGLRYSSSVFPAKHPMFGIANFPKEPSYPNKYGIMEIPQAITDIIGFKSGYAGGAFLRLFPNWFIKRNIDNANRKNRPVFLYLHPREIDADEKRLELSLIDKFFHYYGVSGCQNKFEDLLAQYSDTFMRMDAFEAMYRTS